MTVSPALGIGSLRVRDLLSEESGLKLRMVGGASGLDVTIASARIQKPGLALLGACEYVHGGRVQVMGKSEIQFLRGLSELKRREVLQALLGRRPACVLVTKNQEPPPELLHLAEPASVAVLGTTLVSSILIDRITHFLEERLAPKMQMHGVLLDVYGLGVLIRGDSGVGKSEAALDLVVRGHRLVADDVVVVRRIGNNVLMGTGPEILRHHMELRGMGIINIRDLFGVAAVRQEKALDLVVELSRWDERQHYDRLGLDSDRIEVLEVPLPLLRMPVAPGRNMGILVEVAARNHLMVSQGHHAARELIRRVEARQGGDADRKG